MKPPSKQDNLQTHRQDTMVHRDGNAAQAKIDARKAKITAKTAVLKAERNEEKTTAAGAKVKPKPETVHKEDRTNLATTAAAKGKAMHRGAQADKTKPTAATATAAKPKPTTSTATGTEKTAKPTTKPTTKPAKAQAPTVIPPLAQAPESSKESKPLRRSKTPIWEHTSKNPNREHTSTAFGSRLCMRSNMPMSWMCKSTETGTGTLSQARIRRKVCSNKSTRMKQSLMDYTSFMNHMFPKQGQMKFPINARRKRILF
jgi:hypothetical protein